MKQWKESKIIRCLVELVTLCALMGSLQQGMLLVFCLDQGVYMYEGYFESGVGKQTQAQMVSRWAYNLHIVEDAERKILSSQEDLYRLEQRLEMEQDTLSEEEREETLASAMEIQEELEGTQREVIEESINNFEAMCTSDVSNLQIKVEDNRTGEVLFDTFINKDYSTISTYHLENYTIFYGLQAELPVRDEFYYAGNGFMFLKEQKDNIPMYLVFNLVFSLLMLGFVGKIWSEKETKIGFWDKFPTDVWGLIVIACISVPFIAVSLIYYDERLTYLGTVLFLEYPLTLLVMLLCGSILIIPSFAVMKTVEMIASRGKKKTLLKHSLLGQCGRILWGGGQFGIRSLGKIPVIWRTLVLGLVVCAINFVLGVLSITYMGFFLLFGFYNVVLLVFFCGLAWQMKLLQKGAESLVTGKFQEKINTKWMLLDCKKYGETLNQIGDGIGLAVEENLRSERMKTELITNVSHDVKTPLTSIVTCVELLQQDHSPEEHEEYLALLQRQSMKMKKLVEDLVEASKVTTGNLTVGFVETDLVEAMAQALAEYEEKFVGRKLQIITEFQEDCVVMADGKHLWRVLDNLLSNVCKYAQEGTRVYVAVTNEEKKISIKNISAEPLNVGAEELVERFVRGDSSRTTEGSGLGLHIAQSLMQVQNGNLELTIDGDLVKVILTF